MGPAVRCTFLSVKETCSFTNRHLCIMSVGKFVFKPCHSRWLKIKISKRVYGLRLDRRPNVYAPLSSEPESSQTDGPVRAHGTNSVAGGTLFAGLGAQFFPRFGHYRSQKIVYPIAARAARHVPVLNQTFSFKVERDCSTYLLLLLQVFKFKIEIEIFKTFKKSYLLLNA